MRNPLLKSGNSAQNMNNIVTTSFSSFPTTAAVSALRGISGRPLVPFLNNWWVSSLQLTQLCWGQLDLVLPQVQLNKAWILFYPGP